MQELAWTDIFLSSRTIVISELYGRKEIMYEIEQNELDDK